MAKVELDIRAQITNLNKGLNKTQKQLKELQTQSNKTSKTMQNNMNQTSQVAGQLKGALAGVFAIGTAVSLGKAIINTRAEFEKFNAMLKVALGSAEAANREFSKIQQFAATTPFSVRELTESFVKLVNQGFKPTQKEMRAMGDLAAAMGKDFIQLTEAIIDAQVGEFERLKEFGIRASKEGDNVSLSFKGIEKQVDFTASAIQDAVIGFGAMEGVMGTMEEISTTLGGQLSMLGDSFDLLSNQVGKMSGDQVGDGITIMRNLADITRELLELSEQESQRDGFVGWLERVNEGIGDWILPLISPLGKIQTGVALLADKTTDANEALAEMLESQEDIEDDVDDTNTVIEEQVVSIESLTKKLKGLNEEKKTLGVTDTKRIAEINRETEAIKTQIEELNKLGVALEPKALKDEELAIEDDFDKAEKERDKERLERKKTIDDEIAESERTSVEKRIAIEEAADEQEKLMQEGKIEAANAGFDLLNQLTKDNAELNQAVNIAQAIMNGALGITKTGAELGYPLAIPFQVALGLQTLAQIATIRAQKFEKGGFDVLSGRRHAQGGISIGAGKEAEDGEGQAIFSRQAMRKYGKLLPAFTKDINDGRLDVTEGNAYAFNFDDSNSVSELKSIRELLAQPETRIEGRYKIVTRNGHTQKIKL